MLDPLLQSIVAHVYPSETGLVDDNKPMLQEAFTYCCC